MSRNPLRNIPSVNELLESPPLRRMMDRISHSVVVSTVRNVLDEVRSEVQHAATDMTLPSVSELAERVARRISEAELPPLRPVINATGILLHTNLGRAPLADEALAEIAAVARDYASLEIDLATGRRSRRVVAVEGLLTQLTGAEAALVFNNNAGATMITLAALAAGQEVIVSRGELIEIGGSYRLPDVMEASGAILREVGTTNKTRASDYEKAICERTAAIMLVHPSNYAVVGFAESTSLAELVEIGRKHRVPVIHDIGSGAMFDFSEFGFRSEPVAPQSIQRGADLVLFSGDKLLGGPQCGILVGQRSLVDRIAKHAMARALRVGKLTLAALAATLRLHRDPARARRAIPLLHLLTTSVENLENRARRLAPQIAAAPVVGQAEAIPSTTYFGGGSLPAQELPTWCVAVQPRDISVDRLSNALRVGTPAVVGRIQQGRFLLDLRSVMPRQDQSLVEAVNAVDKGKSTPQQTG